MCTPAFSASIKDRLPSRSSNELMRSCRTETLTSFCSTPRVQENRSHTLTSRTAWTCALFPAKKSQAYYRDDEVLDRGPSTSSKECLYNSRGIGKHITFRTILLSRSVMGHQMLRCRKVQFFSWAMPLFFYVGATFLPLSLVYHLFFLRRTS